MFLSSRTWTQCFFINKSWKEKEGCQIWRELMVWFQPSSTFTAVRQILVIITTHIQHEIQTSHLEFLHCCWQRVKNHCNMPWLPNSCSDLASARLFRHWRLKLEIDEWSATSIRHQNFQIRKKKILFKKQI